MQITNSKPTGLLLVILVNFFRCILSSRSKKLATVFDETVPIEELDFRDQKFHSDAFKIVLDYLYIGSAILSRDIIPELIPEIKKVAVFLQVETIVTFCEHLTDVQRRNLKVTY